MSKTFKEKFQIWIGVIGALFTMGMSIWSFTTALNSYNKLNEIKGDYEVHIKHWESQPLIDIKLIAAGDSCPSGYEEGEVSNDRNALQTIGQFPGSLVWCDCADAGYIWTYQYTQFRCYCGCCGQSYNGTTYYTTSWGAGACSDNAIRAGCSTEDRQQTATETWSTQQGTCHRNATNAGCATDTPTPAIDLEIWKNHVLCYKRGGWTAIERIEHLDVSTGQCEDGIVCQQAQSTQDPTNTICAEIANECPITGLGNITEVLLNNYNVAEPNLTHNTSMAATAGAAQGENFLPIVEVVTSIGSPCWKGSFGQPGRSNNERVANKYDGSCDYDDTRFIEWDHWNEVTLYNENDVGTTGHNWMSGTIPNGTNVTGYSDYQYYNESTDVDWRISYRRQIFWSSTCPSGDISDLAAHLRPLRKVVDFQYALLVLNGIFGLGILGFVIPVFMLLHACDRDNDLPCIPGEGETERRNIGYIQKTLSLTSKLAKLIPLILCLVVTDGIHWFFTTSGEGNCSDSVTNDAMQDLGEQIDSVKNSNWTNLYIDIAMICWVIVPLSIFIYKKYFKKPELPKTEEPNQAPSLQLAPQPIYPSQPIQQPVIQKPVLIQAQAQPGYVQPQVLVQPQMVPGQQIQNPALFIQPQPVVIQQVPMQPQVQPIGQYEYQTKKTDASVMQVMQQAATKVQAMWRGHKVRKDMNGKRGEPMAQFYY